MPDLDIRTPARQAAPDLPTPRGPLSEAVVPVLRAERELAADLLLGIRATVRLEDRLGGYLLDAWGAGRSSLREPLPDAPRPG